MKPTHILVIRSDTAGEFCSLNTQDLKTVTVNSKEETAVIMTSAGKTVLNCMTKHRIDRLSKELNDRYNVLHLPSLRANTTSNDNTIVVVEEGDEKTYIWPKALFALVKFESAPSEERWAVHTYGMNGKSRIFNVKGSFNVDTLISACQGLVRI